MSALPQNPKHAPRIGSGDKYRNGVDADTGLDAVSKPPLPARLIAVALNRIGFDITAEKVAKHPLYTTARKLKTAAELAKTVADVALRVTEVGSVSMGMAVPGLYDAVQIGTELAARSIIYRLDGAVARVEEGQALKREGPQRRPYLARSAGPSYDGLGFQASHG